MRAGPKETLQDIFNFLGSVSFFEYQRISLAVRASNEITQEESDCSLLAVRDWDEKKRREMSSSVCCKSVIMAKSIDSKGFACTRTVSICSRFAANRVSLIDSRLFKSRICGVRASMVDSYGSSDFVKRMEQAWEISQVLAVLYFFKSWRLNQ